MSFFNLFLHVFLSLPSQPTEKKEIPTENFSVPNKLVNTDKAAVEDDGGCAINDVFVSGSIGNLALAVVKDDWLAWNTFAAREPGFPLLDRKMRRTTDNSARDAAPLTALFSG